MAYLTPDAPRRALRSDRRNGIHVLEPSGEIDGDELERIVAALPEKARGWALDMRKVEFLSVSGWRELLRVAYRAREAGVNWVLIPGPAVRPYLRAAAPTDPLRVADTLDDAVRLLAAGAAHRPTITGYVARSRTQC